MFLLVYVAIFGVCVIKIALAAVPVLSVIVVGVVVIVDLAFCATTGIPFNQTDHIDCLAQIFAYHRSKHQCGTKRGLLWLRLLFLRPPSGHSPSG